MWFSIFAGMAAGGTTGLAVFAWRVKDERWHPALTDEQMQFVLDRLKTAWDVYDEQQRYVEGTELWVEIEDRKKFIEGVARGLRDIGLDAIV
jgi:hypothetical protein